METATTIKIPELELVVADLTPQKVREVAEKNGVELETIEIDRVAAELNKQALESGKMASKILGNGAEIFQSVQKNLKDSGFWE